MAAEMLRVLVACCRDRFRGFCEVCVSKYMNGVYVGSLEQAQWIKHREKRKAQT